jgi:hypothetical protein
MHLHNYLFSGNANTIKEKIINKMHLRMQLEGKFGKESPGADFRGLEFESTSRGSCK